MLTYIPIIEKTNGTKEIQNKTEFPDIAESMNRIDQIKKYCFMYGIIFKNLLLSSVIICIMRFLGTAVIKDKENKVSIFKKPFTASNGKDAYYKFQSLVFSRYTDQETEILINIKKNV